MLHKLASRGHWYAVTGAISFSIMAVGVHEMPKTIHTPELLFWRSATALVLIGLWKRRQLRECFFSGAEAAWARGFFGAVAIGLFFDNLRRVPAGVATTLHSCAPVFIAVLSPFLLRRKLSLVSFAGVVIAIAGVATLAVPSKTDVSWIAIAIGLTGALSGALAYISMAKAASRMSAPSIVWLLSLFLFAFSASRLNWTDGLAVGQSDLVPLLVVLLSSLAAQLFVTLSYVYLDPVSASVISLTEIVWTVGYDVSLGNEAISTLLVTGALATIVGVALAGRSRIGPQVSLMAD